MAKSISITAKSVLAELEKIKSAKELLNVQRFFTDLELKTSQFIGVRMGSIFKLAKDSTALPIKEIEKLLKSKFYEARMCAVSIMDFQARNKKTTEEQKEELFNLYINNHKHINNWDLVDRSAPHVVGGYLVDKPRAILYKLAKSKNPWERRTSIVSTWFFIRQNDVKDTFKIAALLVNDTHELVQKAVGSWVREAGKRDKPQLITFLDKHAAVMPRTLLRYAIERLDTKQKKVYMNMKSTT